jgi:hypothetical protein
LPRRIRSDWVLRGVGRAALAVGQDWILRLNCWVA